MYIMKDTPIKISEFRRNTKVILDATRDNDQWLRRGDDLFRIQYMGTVYQGVPAEIAPPKKISEPEARVVAPRVDDLIKQAPEYDAKVAERQLSGELPCCANDTAPCRHWVWDVGTGEGYRNTLSGRYKEAE